MPTIKGIITFPTLFKPQQVKDAAGQPTGEPKYSATLLLSPDDPQLTALKTDVDQLKANAYPSGFPPGTHCCLQTYDDAYSHKEYYDPRFKGWWAFSCTAKENDKPAVVDAQHQPIIDPGAVFSGAIVWLNAGVSAYTKGKGGIGGWLNGVMVTGEIGEFGRLDGKPSVDQMFNGVDTGAAPTPPTPPVPPTAAPPKAPQFPPEGWVAHPDSPGYFYCGQEVLSEDDLRAKFNLIKTSF